MRALVTVVLAVMSVAVSLSASADQNSPFGVVSAPGLANDVCRQDDLSYLGVGWVRAGWEWPAVEVAQDNFQWEQPDRLMDEMTSRGIWVYWDFSYAPCWANGRPCYPGEYGPGTYETSDADKVYTPLSQTDLRQYVMTVVKRYRNHKVIWGAWNEANLWQFYRPPGGAEGQTNVNKYTAAGRELRTIVDAIRDADARAQIVVGELSDHAASNHGWLRQILDATAGKFDAISLHVYGKGGAAPNYCSARLAKVDAFRTDIVAWGYGAYPTWVTETGGGLSDFGGSVAGQRAFMSCFWTGMQQRPWWKKSFWYRYEYEPNQTGLLDGGPDQCMYDGNSKFYHYRNNVISTWPALPGTPSSLAATAGDGRVTLSWAAAASATTYNIKRTTLPTGHHVQIATGVTGLSYVDTPVTNGTQYYYVVSASNTGGESLDSDEVFATPQAESSPVSLAPGEVLYPDQYVSSPDGRFLLYYQSDGNLVLYTWHWYPLWSSDTSGTNAGLLAMQTDGNLVVYDPDWNPLWWSGTQNNPGAFLSVQNDGEMLIYSSGGSPLWSSGTCCW